MLEKNIQAQSILILDFGSQYTQLIARRIRECGVYCEIYAYDVSDKQITDFAPSGIILSGGPETVLEHETPRAPNIVFELGCPVLGICYGMQTMAVQLGGQVDNSHSNKEFGYAEINRISDSTLLKDIEDKLSETGEPLLAVWMSHGDQVVQLPRHFKCIARSKDCEFAAIAYEERGFYGLQFHPEVTHTLQGMRILKRFVQDICGCEPRWTSENILQDRIARIQEQVGDDRVLLGLSGGVDSSVVAILLHQAIGTQLTCVFVDTGLLRENEAKELIHTFHHYFKLNVVHVDAGARFFEALKGVTDPEHKRKIIGQLFVTIFEEESEKLSNIQWLAQGTIYPDVIESAAAKTGKAHVIKSHHNVGGLPERMKFQLLEPLRELFKDEVRQLGLELGLAHETVYRHPFPGPGLGVRILGEVTQMYADILRKADKIFIQALREYGYYDQVSQAFAVFLPVKSVGVAGDGRKYDYVIALRAVETVDFMTAHAAELPYAFLREVSRRILNQVPQVSRVTYDISDKPPATIEWE